MQAASSRVPALLDALYARLEPVLTGWQTFDGPPAAQIVENDVCVIGHPDFDGVAISVDAERSQGLGHRYTETITIRCVLSSQTGDEDVKARRDRCLVGFALVEDALQQDRGLGGVVDLVQIGPGELWSQAQTEQGATAEVAFDITARVTR